MRYTCDICKEVCISHEIRTRCHMCSATEKLWRQKISTELKDFLYREAWQNDLYGCTWSQGMENAINIVLKEEVY